jgi:hypothetical protein
VPWNSFVTAMMTKATWWNELYVKLLLNNVHFDAIDSFCN